MTAVTDQDPGSLLARLEPLLARVSKPVQYVGGEHNAVVKDWEQVEVRWCLMYPDAYEVGQPNQGIAILYEVLNEVDWVLAERTYAVWPDFAAQLREHQLPQPSLDGHRPVRAFDLLGVSFSTELGYTNLLHTLDLAQVPLHAADRDDSHPVVIAGGHAAFNPEPVADFIDVAVLGDGEQAVLRISELVREWKRQGRPGGRAELLLRLARSGCGYVPSLYQVDYLPDGRIAQVVPTHDQVPARVSKHTLENLDQWPYPKAPLVPLAETVHERYSVEVFRGCTRGCRFCQAGMITRPVRERSIDTIGAMVERGLRATGLEEVGLLSLSSADHSEITEVTRQLADRYQDTFVSLSLPSTRVDAFNIDLANELCRNGRRSGLTFAPEGGSERLRRVINKTVSEQDLIDTVTAAFAAGWRQVKLYFMCGLPTETDEDVLGIADLARKVVAAGRAATGSRDIRCTVSVGGFVPKAHTPFQWAGQAPAETIDRRLQLLRDEIRTDRSYGKAIGLRYHDGKPGMVEGLLSRGDRRVGRVIEAVYRDGGIFDGWSEYFSYERWQRCAEAELAPYGVDLDWYTTRERDEDEVLPWDHLDAGLDRDWLWEDWQDALDGTEVEDCRWTECYDCGVCPQLGTQTDLGPTGRRLLPLTVLRRPGLGGEAAGSAGDAPGRSRGRCGPQESSQGQVMGPTIPSASRPDASWKALTAARVAGPKEPSTSTGRR
ncbi:MAG: TIGR03960 family B12-binding radical SAM protein [Actinomycetia bacterium]|nr:TIGR03960 family B12-binding radical SAM protein [Actinomycetes bacterium]